MTLDINTRNVYYDSCFVDFFCVHSWSGRGHRNRVELTNTWDVGTLRLIRIE